MLVETFIRKLLHLKAHYVTAVEQSSEQIVVEIDRFRFRMLRCGVCQGRCRKVHQVEAARSWQDLSLRQFAMVLRYRPRRVCCRHCGVRVEAVPWAQLWARVTTALAAAVAELARHLSWQQTARHFRLDWKSVARIVRRVVAYGLERRRRRPLHVLGIDEVSRRKGHHYLTVVYDLERRVLLWVGEDRTEDTLTRFFTQLGRRRSATLRVVCMDMWQAYFKAVRRHAPNAQVLFDRFHLVQHLNRAVDEVRRSEMRRLSGREKTSFKRTRFLLLKNPWNLRSDERERLSTLVRWNSPIVRAYYLKEAFQLFWGYRQAARAEQHLCRWMHSALRSRLEPFKKFVRMLRDHLDGVLAWTRLRLSNGALEGMNNKIKLVSHRSFGFRTVQNYTAAIYHCCAQLPLPEE
ncbi:MAG: ISL3 family transposase [Terriglobia bacterium]